MLGRTSAQSVTLIVAFGALLAGSAEAGVDEWTHHGPWGSNPEALAIDPASPETLYVGLSRGGVTKSTNGGDSWSPVGTGLDPLASIDGLAIDPHATATVFAQADDRLYKTTDGGAHWTPIENLEARWPVAFDPQTPGTVYAVSFGDDGLLRSTDGGATWTAADTGLPQNPTVLQLAIDPQTPTTLYAATAEQGVYKSIDGGTTWTASSNGLGAFVEPTALVIDPQTPSTLYTAGCCNGELYKSTDGGASWALSNQGLSFDNSVVLAIDPSTPTTVYAGTNDTFEESIGSVYKSLDGGATWSLTEFGPAFRVLAVDPSAPGTVYAATTPDGVLRSTDGGATWESINQGIANTQVSSLVIDAQAPYTLYAGAFANNVHRSVDRALTWAAAENGVDGFYGIPALAVDPQNPLVVYAGIEFIGGTVFKSLDGGVSWDVSDVGLEGFAVQSLAIDPASPATVYAGTVNGGVYKSTDFGTSWVTFANELENGSAYALAIDPRDPQTLYAGTVDGIYKSTDGGVTWAASNAGIPSQVFLPQIVSLVLDPSNPDVVYAGGEGGAYKSTDGAANWVQLDLFADLNALAIDPQIPSILYAGGRDGAWRSTDGGATWAAFDAGLAGHWVLSLAVDPGDPTYVYAGTANGGVFVRRVISEQPILGLHGGRFQASVTWRDFGGEVGSGNVAAVLTESTGGTELRSQDSAVAQFFDPDNWEQLIKVLDGRAFNDHYWVFLASATDVGLTTTVTDTACGDVQIYENPLGQDASAVTDTTAFPGCASPLPASCAPGDGVFCLGEDGRFQVEPVWRDFANQTGPGNQAVIPTTGLAKSDDSGLFYFFSDTNWELLVKVLDGCGINDHYWVFTAGTTDVEYTLTVTDTQTGQVQTYGNALGEDAVTVTDTAAFATCP